MPSHPVRSVAPLLAVAWIAAIALACSPSSPTPTPGLTDSSWTVTSINGASMMVDAPPTMTFSSDGNVHGTGGCNQYTAPYQTDGNKLMIGPMSSTLMLCDGDRGAQEAAFVSGLGGAMTWLITQAGDLEIDGSAKIVANRGIAASATSPTPGAALGGTAWNLTEMGGTADFAHIVPTVEFGADGRVSGFAGCNTFSGTFTTDGATPDPGSVGYHEDRVPAPGQRRRGRVPERAVRRDELGGRRQRVAGIGRYRSAPILTPLIG